MTKNMILVVLLLALCSVTALSQSDTGWQDPSQNTGNFKDPHRAYHDDTNKAEAEKDEVNSYWGYTFSLDEGVQITGIQVRLDADPDKDPINAELAVELSWDGGSTWTTTWYSAQIPQTGARETHILGGPSDTWGHTWVASELGSTSFRIRITATMDGARVKVKLYWVPVTVYYTEPGQDPSIGGSGSWTLPIGPSDLIAGAGSDLVASYESAVDAVLLFPDPDGEVPYRVDVRRVDTVWHGSLVLWIRRTGDGMGTGSISDGTTYLMVTTTDQTFFTGVDYRNNVPIQFRLTGVSIQTPSGIYETTVYYTIVATG